MYDSISDMTDHHRYDCVTDDRPSQVRLTVSLMTGRHRYDCVSGTVVPVMAGHLSDSFLLQTADSTEK